MIFETERLLVRELRKEDLPGFYDLHRNANVMQYTSGKVQTFEESLKELNHVISCYSIPGNTFRVWALVRKSDFEWIGTTAIILTKKDKNDIGYRIREKHWGNGYAKEVAEGLIRYAFSELKLDELDGVSDVRNKASIRILEQMMDFVSEYYNPEFDCMERLYKLYASARIP